MPPSQDPPSGHISIRGARQHNLKNLDLDLPLGQLTVITGPSGSGKTSLAFHTLFAEGQRRYVETFSPYVRQFFDRMDKPAVDRIDGIPPAIAIEQKNTIRTTRSTVGTLTEINDYLKLLYPRLAKAHDPRTGKEIRPDTPASILKSILGEHSGQNLLITFPVTLPENTALADFLPILNSQGYLRLLLPDGQVLRTDTVAGLQPGDPNQRAVGSQPADTANAANNPPQTLHIIQDRLKASENNSSRLHEALETALRLGKGQCAVFNPESATHEHFDTTWHPLRQPTPALFSFNNPLGACPDCRGFGRVIGIDLDKAIPDHRLSLKKGAIKPFEGERGAECQRDLLRHCPAVGIDPRTPYRELSPGQQHWIKYGERTKKSPLSSLEQSEQLWEEGKWYGIKGFFDWLETKSYKMHVRVFLARYRAYTTCDTCQGTRLQPEALAFTIKNKTLPELWQVPIDELATFARDLQSEILAAPSADPSLKLILDEITSRLHYLQQVGLGYLTLDRPARTLSGGEIARVNLTTCLGSALTHTLFVLDEPTVGLHARDIGRLTGIMHSLRDKGNTLLVVEHDDAVMHAADRLLDIGPGSGEHGGQLTYQGPPPRNLGVPPETTSPPRNLGVSPETTSPATKSHKSPQSLHPAAEGSQGKLSSATLPYLSGQKSIPRPENYRAATRFLEIRHATCHNLKDLSLDLPLDTFVCLTGVSGSGKSTLAHPVIHRHLARHFGHPLDEEPAPAELSGLEQLADVQLIDQSPLARTPRSTPAVLLGAFTHIRELFALQTGESPGFFSFNSGKGRCDRCGGNGFEKVEMQFLSDLFLTCPACHGSRYNAAALQHHYQGQNIADILQLTATEALDFFRAEGFQPADPSHPRRLEAHNTSPPTKKEAALLGKIATKLQPLIDTGLGYLRLGQPLNTLSGGEAQRLKLCQLLTQIPTSKSKVDASSTLLILDEPTTGLHFTDIEKLLRIFHRLVDSGYSLLVIEHHLDVIKNADHIIDLGPEAGQHGGQITAQGSPEEVAQTDTHTGRALASLGKTQKAKNSQPKATPATQSPNPPLESSSLGSCV
ncbi:MAG: excinuclease ABC subunit UvrA, partial [Verrucomicrobiales bacterium]